MTPKLNCILLVDDDEPTNFLSQMIISEANCTQHIQVAQSGAAALDYLRQAQLCASGQTRYPCPDLIFLDVNMPAMNGWEFLERYAALPAAQKGHVVMVMLTTSLNPDDKLKAADIPDVAGFENKPLTAEKLELVLAKYFSAQKPAQTLTASQP